MSDFLFDTNVFDYMLENGISPEAATAKGQIFVTNVQISEIANIPDESRRRNLQAIANVLSPKKLLLESGVWCDDLRWDDHQPWRDDTTPAFDDIRGESNSTMDAMIGDVAHRDGLVLVSNDRRLRGFAADAGISVLTTAEFFRGASAP
jgi:rRNA-processing protein FCF1